MSLLDKMKFDELIKELTIDNVAYVIKVTLSLFKCYVNCQVRHTWCNVKSDKIDKTNNKTNAAQK